MGSFDIQQHHMHPSALTSHELHTAMGQITTRLPDELIAHLDATAARLKRSRAQVVRHAIEYYLDDAEDLRLGLERLEDPSDPLLDWDSVRRELLDQDQG